jgi:hypothetical protein
LTFYLGIRELALIVIVLNYDHDPIRKVVIVRPTVWIFEAIGVVRCVLVPIEVPARVAIRGDRIHGEEASDGGIVIALNTLTRRDSAPPTVRSLDAAWRCECSNR